MDFDRTLQQLYLEKKRLDQLIARLEARLTDETDKPRRSTRGRKNMGSEERLQVSARMTAYWAARREQRVKSAVMNSPATPQETMAHEASV